jgi:hypothetical protein
MPAVWTAPRTWAVGELVTAALLNTHLRDNLEALKVPPTALHNVNQGSDYQTTSTSFVNVDATNLALTIVTGGGDVLIGFYGFVNVAAGAKFAYFDVEIDGVRMAGDDGLVAANSQQSANQAFCVSFVTLKQGLAAGTHTFKLQWKATSAATLTLYAGAGTTALDLHPQFWVREVS